MEIILDIQGFQGQTFIAKELAWITVDGGIEEISSVTVFETCHYIPWTQGQIPYDRLTKIIGKAVANKQFIYVKGLEKKRWLQNIVKSKTIIDLENLDCPPLKKRQDFQSNFCNSHEQHAPMYWCALENVKKLKEWFLKNYCGNPSLEKSLKLFCKLNIENMRPRDIAMLPKYFIIGCAADKINSIWSKLPAVLQEDKDIIKYRRCNIHYSPTAIDYDDFFNDIPLVIIGRLCRKNKL
uniref:Uncharacterized protein n=1 Tax=Glyptapanteles flavicoxis TaxID=463051 RepID=B7S8N8_9HYME|nr:hypothetical protein GFP_L5_0110 [Glyptapanteles flavicoxis]